MYGDPLVPFELSHIGQPFLVGLLCVKLTVQKILCNELGILGVSGTAVVAILHRRTNVSGPADPQHPFVIDMNAIVVTKIAVKLSVALVRAFLMDFFNFVSQTLNFPWLCGSAFQNPICSKLNGKHGAVRRPLQRGIPFPRGIP